MRHEILYMTWSNYYIMIIIQTSIWGRNADKIHKMLTHVHEEYKTTFTHQTSKLDNDHNCFDFYYSTQTEREFQFLPLPPKNCILCAWVFFYWDSVVHVEISPKSLFQFSYFKRVSCGTLRRMRFTESMKSVSRMSRTCTKKSRTLKVWTEFTDTELG